VFTVAIVQVMPDLGGCWRVSETSYAYASIGSCCLSIVYGGAVSIPQHGIMLAGEFPASPLENSIILQMCIRRQNVLSDAESHCSVHHGCMRHP
jgi:hypothetical protein